LTACGSALILDAPDNGCSRRLQHSCTAISCVVDATGPPSHQPGPVLNGAVRSWPERRRPSLPTVPGRWWTRSVYGFQVEGCRSAGRRAVRLLSSPPGERPTGRGRPPWARSPGCASTSGWPIRRPATIGSSCSTRRRNVELSRLYLTRRPSIAGLTQCSRAAVLRRPGRLCEMVADGNPSRVATMSTSASTLGRNTPALHLKIRNAEVRSNHRGRRGPRSPGIARRKRATYTPTLIAVAHESRLRPKRRS